MTGKQFFERLWYGGSKWAYLLWPFSLIFASATALRRCFYRIGLFTRHQFDKPVIVVGNITVGGSGKTPVVIALLERLKAAGYKPGVVSRGYRGDAESYPVLLSEQSLARDVGDEPLLIWRRTQAPVVVDPQRPRAVNYLIQHCDCDVIISDDGLQHYAMARDFEIALVDAKRGLGNGYLLPAGPLREPVKRLQSVDWVMSNGRGGARDMSVEITVDGIRDCTTASPVDLQQLKTKTLHAVAGIASPERFFDTLTELGLQFTPHVFDDHHPFIQQDLAFADDAYIIMTEKDAVKCSDFASSTMCYLAISAELPEQLCTDLLVRLAQKSGREPCLV